MPDTQLKHHPKKGKTLLQGVNLTKAISLICQAGYSDPRLEASEGETALLQRVIDALCDLSMHDGLTGLTNRRYFQIALKREVHRAARDGESCVLLMLDIDHFKSINDRHGHPMGDKVLGSVADRLMEFVRPGDTLSRYGGEEFTVILPKCPLRHAVLVAERLRLHISETPIQIPENSPINVTISIGAAVTNPFSEPDPSGLLKSADANLYKAKSAGRNQTCSDPPVTTTVTSMEKTALFKKRK